MSAGVDRPAADAQTDTERELALYEAINGLRENDPLNSASIPLVGWQRPVLWGLLLTLVACVIAAPMATAVALIGICTFGYVVTMLDRVMIFRNGLSSRAIVVSDEEAGQSPTRPAAIHHPGARVQRAGGRWRLDRRDGAAALPPGQAAGASAARGR